MRTQEEITDYIKLSIKYTLRNCQDCDNIQMIVPNVVVYIYRDILLFINGWDEVNNEKKMVLNEKV